MEFLDAYVDLCKTLGPLVDWVQGAGGNISFKNDKNLLIKASGFALGATSRSEGWVCCDLKKILALFEADSHEDFAGVVVEGTGKPSIETFLHCLPKKIVVHLHPMNFLPFLCASDTSGADEYPIVPYIKPGLQLGKALFAVYNPSLNVYMLANHGVVIAGDTTEEIFTALTDLSSRIPSGIPKSDPVFVQKIRRALPDLLIRPILQAHPSTFHSRVFLPYTPDIVVFLQKAPLFFDELSPNPEKALTKYQETYKMNPTIIYTPCMMYSVAPSLSKCVAIEEIFCAYLQIPPTGTQFLNAAQIDELINWDKEKERKSAK